MAFNKIEIYGGGDINYVWSRDTAVSNEEINSIVQNGVCSPEWGVDSIALATFNNNLKASNFNNDNILCYKIQRRNIKENVVKTVANIDKIDTKIIDINIGNKATYKYYITPMVEIDGKEVVGQTLETKEFNTNWHCWSVIGLHLVDGNTYIIDDNNIWKFHLNLEAGDYKPVYSKTYTNGMGRYPKGFSGETNYIKGSLSCYLGDVDKFGSYKNDDVDKLKQWREFCNNGEMKLIRDIKGNVFLADIEDTSLKPEHYANGDPTKISFNFIELGDAEKVCAYKVVSE